MRITNPMVTNKMMLNINRNSKIVNTLYNKLSTGKELELPSDNPILAARALKFRINVSETQQYMRNVDQGLSWMEVSDKGMGNVINIFETMRELTVRGASDVPFTSEDRKKIAGELGQLVEQIGSEMNISYAGRYVFAGYRTNEPPILTKELISNFRITQDFNIDDLDKTKAFQILPQAGDAPEYVVKNVNVIKLAYTQEIDFTYAPAGGTVYNPADPTTYDNTTITINGTQYAINVVSVSAAGAYDPDETLATPQVNYIKETGELVFGDGAVADIVAAGKGGFSVSYDCNRFAKGELNPRVNFNCWENWAFNPVTNAYDGFYDVNGQNMQYEFGVNTRINVNEQSKDIYTATMYADLRDFVESIKSVRLSSDEELRQIFTAQGMSGEALEEAIHKQMLYETQQVQGYLQKKFSNAIGLIDKHFSNVSVKNTDMGSRMNRLELIQNRLENDEINYTKLLSANEDADYIDVIMRLNSAESIYQAALNMGAKIMQTSLADYVR